MVWVQRLGFVEQGSGRRLEMQVDRVLNGGYAGRDSEAVRKHVEELAAIGVPAPSRVPTLYALGNNLASTSDLVQVQHAKTSGEVEYVLLFHEGEIYVTVGSDQTDRDLESISVEWSKQSYPDMIAPEVWLYRDVSDHWDQLVIRCWATRDRERSLYQESAMAALLPPESWLDQLRSLFGAIPDNLVLMSGTVAALGGLVFADSYDLEMHDPVLGRTLRHSYQVQLLREKLV